MHRRILFSLLIFAMVSATISPACAFIMGKSGSWIEICSGLKTIKVQTDNQEIPDVTGDDCPFCFQYFKNTALGNDILVLDGLIHLLHFQGFVDEQALIAFYQSYHSRAPPQFS